MKELVLPDGTIVGKVREGVPPPTTLPNGKPLPRGTIFRDVAEAKEFVPNAGAGFVETLGSPQQALGTVGEVGLEMLLTGASTAVPELFLGRAAGAIRPALRFLPKGAETISRIGADAALTGGLEAGSYSLREISEGRRPTVGGAIKSFGVGSAAGIAGGGVGAALRSDLWKRFTGRIAEAVPPGAQIVQWKRRLLGARALKSAEDLIEGRMELPAPTAGAALRETGKQAFRELGETVGLDMTFDRKMVPDLMDWIDDWFEKPYMARIRESIGAQAFADLNLVVKQARKGELTYRELNNLAAKLRNIKAFQVKAPGAGGPASKELGVLLRDAVDRDLTERILPSVGEEASKLLESALGAYRTSYEAAKSRKLYGIIRSAIEGKGKGVHKDIEIFYPDVFIKRLDDQWQYFEDAFRKTPEKLVALKAFRDEMAGLAVDIRKFGSADRSFGSGSLAFTLGSIGAALSGKTGAAEFIPQLPWLAVPAGMSALWAIGLTGELPARMATRAAGISLGRSQQKKKK